VGVPQEGRPAAAGAEERAGLDSSPCSRRGSACRSDGQEADCKAKEQADRKAKEEADCITTEQEEADRTAKEQADSKAAEEGDHWARHGEEEDEADCKAKDQADREAKEEADHKANEEEAGPQLPRRTKIVFFVRHAQSQWNRSLNTVKNPERLFRDPSQALPIIYGGVGLGAQIGQSFVQQGLCDHKLSKDGEEQARRLCEHVARERHKTKLEQNDQPPQVDCEDTPDRRTYYELFFNESLRVYCSPMLRAIQTAHLALRADAGWGPLVLLKDAREVKGSWAERDCVGEAEGRGIVERAMRECHLPGLAERVDWARSDCQEGRWWSDSPESDEEVDRRLDALLRRLLDEDEAPSCICVTHSNLIRRLMMRKGDVGGEDNGNVGQEGGEEAAGRGEDALSRTWSWELPTVKVGTFQRAKVEKLMNCGVLGVRFARERQGWVARDVCMMFGSQFEGDPVEAQSGS